MKFSLPDSIIKEQIERQAEDSSLLYILGPFLTFVATNHVVCLGFRFFLLGITLKDLRDSRVDLETYAQRVRKYLDKELVGSGLSSIFRPMDADG